MRPVVCVVAAALVDPQGRVLMQRRPEGREHGGLWEFPGGKIEPGEGPLAALARELREELAIEVAPADCVPLGFAASEPDRIAASERAVVLLLYGVRQWQGMVRSMEGAALAWTAPADLAALAMPPLDIPLARLAGDFAA